jgi:capsule polysaccharide export protein KpsE/RkpR
VGSLPLVTEPDDHEERIAALEADAAAMRSRLSRAEQDAAAARVLAGGADRDVGDLGGEFREFRSEMRGFRDQNNRVLSAMRADLTDGFTAARAELATVRAEMHQGFTEVRGLLDAQAAFSRQLADMLGVLVRREGGGRPEQ